MQYTLRRKLSDLFLIFFMCMKMSIRLYNGDKTCSSTLSCHDLNTVDGEPMFNGTAGLNIVYFKQPVPGWLSR